MARGWESKSVEAQQAEASADTAKARRAPRTPEQIIRERQRENLRLARKRVLQQLEVSQNERHQRLLRETLADLDRQLQKLE